MPLVTIRGQMGSGAPEIGEKVAQLLESDYVDREILEGVAEMLERPLAEIEEKKHISTQLIQKISGTIERRFKKSDSTESTVHRNWNNPLEDDEYLDAIESVIQDLSLEGNLVLLGWGSQFILHNYQSAFHVLVIAPMEDRITRIMASLKVDENEAQKQIEEFDNNNRAFVHKYFKGELDNPVYYDVVINTEHITYDTAARIIATSAKEKTPWTHG